MSTGNNVIGLIIGALQGAILSMYNFEIFGTNMLYILVGYATINLIVEFFFRGDKRNGK